MPEVKPAEIQSTAVIKVVGVACWRCGCQQNEGHRD